MTTKIEKITKELLQEWNACNDGYTRFNELFPDGADLKTAIDGLVEDGHDDWGNWLFQRCKECNLFPKITEKGYRNSGDENSGYGNSGSRNSGDGNSGDGNSGYGNSGSRNSGYWNSGSRNSGEGNSGYWNSGSRNSGSRNSGDGNSGDGNSGSRNSGDWNSGSRNSGYGNSGDGNSGFFNTIRPSQILFNKDSGLAFESEIIQKLVSILCGMKPILTWIYSENMTDEEKANNPSHVTTGGYLKEQDYKYCWQKNWEDFSEETKNFFKSLPNFDAKVFEEITGIKI